MKKIESLIPVLFILLNLCFLAGCSQTNIPAKEMEPFCAKENNRVSIEFSDNYIESQKLASKENKPLFLFFKEPNCIFSNKMQKETFCNNKIIALSKSFVCVQIDMSLPSSDKLCQLYHVKGSPTIQFVSAQGRPLQQITQCQTPEKVEQQMEMVLHSIAWRESQTLIR